MPQSPRQAKKYAGHAADAAGTIASRRWIGQLARWGYAAIGIVYLLVGVLTLMGLAGVQEGQTAGSGEATRTVLTQPFGRVLLGIIAGGLVIYVAWRFCQSVLDIEDRGSSTTGLLRRFGLLLSGLSYTGLAVAAVERLVTGSGQVQSQKADWTEALMSYPAGVFLVGTLGIVVIGVALVQFRAAVRAGFMDMLKTSAMVGSRAAGALGRLGFAARGVVFSIIGVFLVVAALRSNPEEAMGLGGALQWLAQQSYGTVLIGVVALGLFSYGLFMLVKATFRYIAPQDDEEESEEPETSQP